MAIGLVLILIWAYLIMFVDLLDAKLKKGLFERWFIAGFWFFIAAVSWLIGYGAGSLFFIHFLGNF